MIYSDGDKYTGLWKKDNYNGRGMFSYNNGDKYVGEWKEGKKKENDFLLGVMVIDTKENIKMI